MSGSEIRDHREMRDIREIRFQLFYTYMEILQLCDSPGNIDETQDSNRETLRQETITALRELNFTQAELADPALSTLLQHFNMELIIGRNIYAFGGPRDPRLSNITQDPSSL